ncbi:MAG: GlsB/YeaQ/YmgE family stress response membrane protein [Acidobacteria bacterium]|nr:GlsB/YeaQ/YmgE family stress response membrane protein [Acidobacteriota bacterium]
MIFLWWTIIGTLAGWQTGKVLKGFGYGPLIDTVMGIAGALAGGFVMRSAGLPGVFDLVGTTMGAILGAAASTGLVGYASGRSRYA